MTATVLNTGEAAKQLNGISEGDAFDILYSESIQQNSELTAVDKMNSSLSTDGTFTLSQSQKSTDNDPGLENTEAGISTSDPFDIVYSASTPQNSELTSADRMKSCLSTDETTAPSQGPKSTENNPSDLENVEGCQENKENALAYKAAKDTVKRKFRNVFDSDSEKEDDFLSSLLNKSYADEPLSLLKSPIASAKLGQSSRRLIDSESEGEDSTIALKNTNNYDKESSDEDGNLVEPEMKKAKKSRIRTLIDSDSEDDNDLKSIQNAQENKSEKASDEESATAKVIKKQKVSSTVDSTTDEDEGSENSTSRLSSVGTKKLAKDRKKKTKEDKKIVKSRFRTLVDSESEEESVATEKSHKENDENVNNDQSRLPKSKISSLIDTDSEDDGTRNNVDEQPRDQHQKSGKLSKTEKPSKKRTGSIRASKDEAMRQIHSETQRLIRASEVSLPYHRPKQRSLQEFLNRKQFIPTLPEGLTTAAKVKMSSQIVGKVLEEKEKEAELFYKSSDSEDEIEMSSTPADFQAKNEQPTADKTDDHQNIEETQKLLKNNVQNAHNKKEIIQQCGLDLGVPRKLFANGSEDSTENKSTETQINNEEATEDDDPKKKPKETKLGLKEAIVPRKLFGNDIAQAIAPTNSQETIVETLKCSEINETVLEPLETQVNEKFSNSLTSIGEAPTKPQLDEISTDKNIENIDVATSNAIEEKINEISNIFDTPFISNKEIAKLNEKITISQNFDDPDEKMDEDDSGIPDGHVYGLPLPDLEVEDRHVEKMRIKQKLQSNVVPKLRGTPGMFIDFSDDVKPNREGVQSLVDRFIRHSAPTKSVESSPSVTVLHTEKTADGLKIVEQILPYKLQTTDNVNDKELSKPGAKYLLLKKELIEKMAKKRNEEWRIKEQQEKHENSEGDEEIDDEEIEDEEECEADEDNLHDKLQVSSESEPEENDLPNEKKKKRKNRDFADEEAEVSGEDGEDDEDDEEDEENDEEVETRDADDEDDEDKHENQVIDEDDDTCDVLSNAEDEATDKTKKLSRIARAFEDDSNSLPENSVPTEKTFERTKTDVDIFANEDGNDGWMSDTEAEIPPSQIPRDQTDGRSQLCKTPLTAVNILRFVSPITQLTAFDSCNESPKDNSATKRTPRPFLGLIDSSVEKTPLTKKSPFYDSEKRNGFQKKLFEDPSGVVNDDELMDLCSGKFTGLENDCEAAESSNKLSERRFSDLSSGSFLAKEIESETFEKTGGVVDEASQDIRLTLDDESEDSRDKIIDKNMADEPKNPWANFKVASSSDEENSKDSRSEVIGRKKILKKKKVKQLELSDEEEEQESSEQEDKCEVPNNDDEDKYVDYDSEENEVVIVPKKDIKKVAAGFLDEEAELSESEWGSADEDEKDLDKLEVEEGDDEEIDENQMRDQLGKMHARQQLDDDQREVRMLQELLFDDGDLHTEGSGRERQFRWKNIDNFDNDDNLGPRDNDLDENGDVIEEENELEWRKQRFEREKFIAKEKSEKSEEKAKEELASDSQIFKLGMRALKKSKSIQILQKDSGTTFTKKPFMPMNVLDLVASTTGTNAKTLSKAVKRGSFLARGEECLARLALTLKEDSGIITTRTNPGKFVFAHISPSVAGTADKETKGETEKNGDSLADANTKKRKPPSDNTPRTSKKAKIEVTRSSGKKLF